MTAFGVGRVGVGKAIMTVSLQRKRLDLYVIRGIINSLNHILLNVRLHVGIILTFPNLENIEKGTEAYY